MQKKNIANILTITRIAVVFIIFIIYKSSVKWWAEACFVLFLIGALSDFFDGFFARKYNIQSDFGTCFDPICDKIFVFGMLLLLFELKYCSFIVLFLIVSRELLVSGVREYLAPKGIKMPVTSLTKYKTGFQMAAIGILIFYQGFYFKSLFNVFWLTGIFFDILPLLGFIALHLALVLTLYTGYLYLKKQRVA